MRAYSPVLAKAVLGVSMNLFSGKNRTKATIQSSAERAFQGQTNAFGSQY